MGEAPPDRKRLQAFEAAINDQPLPKTDRDFMEHGGDPA